MLRVRLVQQAKLQAFEQKRVEKLAKLESRQIGLANQWWCDCAGEGCLRPEQGCYDRDSYYTIAGNDYTVCVACFDELLTDEQRAEMSFVEV